MENLFTSEIKKGAENFIEKGKTEIVDYTGKGLVMPSCGNGHAHYLSGFAVESIGIAIDRETTPEQFLKEIVPAAVKKARDTGATSVLGFGWKFLKFEKNMPTRQQLDAICSDMPMFFADEEGGHKALANTLALVNAEIMSADGKVLKKEVRGGEIVFGADGTVETGTGFIEPLYTDGHQGIDNWNEDEVAYITRKSNEKNLTMHIHTMGNKAINRVVSAFVKGGKDELRNTLVHVHFVNDSD